MSFLITLMLSIGGSHAETPFHQALFRQCATKHSIKYVERVNGFQELTQADQVKLKFFARDLNRKYQSDCMKKAGITGKPQASPRKTRVPFEKCLAEKLNQAGA